MLSNVKFQFLKFIFQKNKFNNHQLYFSDFEIFQHNSIFLFDKYRFISFTLHKSSEEVNEAKKSVLPG